MFQLIHNSRPFSDLVLAHTVVCTETKLTIVSKQLKYSVQRYTTLEARMYHVHTVFGSQRVQKQRVYALHWTQAPGCLWSLDWRHATQEQDSSLSPLCSASDRVAVNKAVHIRANPMFAIRQSIGLKYLLSGSWNIVRPVYRVVHSKRYP
jgi:hypothetical protein